MLRDEFGWTQRCACRALKLARSTARYAARPDRDEAVIAVLQELAERFEDRGFGKLFQLIRRRGHGWNHKRVWRGGYPRFCVNGLWFNAVAYGHGTEW